MGLGPGEQLGWRRNPGRSPHWRAPHPRGRPGLGSGGPQVPAPRRTSKAPLSTVTADPPPDGAGGWLRGPRAIPGPRGPTRLPSGTEAAPAKRGRKPRRRAPLPTRLPERFRVGTATAGGRKARRTVSPPKRRKLRPGEARDSAKLGSSKGSARTRAPELPARALTPEPRWDAAESGVSETRLCHPATALEGPR